MRHWKPSCGTESLACETKYTVSHVHLASIEGSILLEETVMCNYCVLKEWRLRGSTHRMEEILIDLVGYGLWFCVSQKGGKPVYLCFVWLQDDPWCAACSWCHGLHSISRHLCVLYLMHMHLINDAVYVAGRVSLLSRRFMSPVTWPKCRVEAALYCTYTALPQVASHKVLVTFFKAEKKGKE